MKRITNISPFLLLLVPMLVAIVVFYLKHDDGLIYDRINLKASFIITPDITSLKTFLGF